jgi:hypothetical protein
MSYYANIYNIFPFLPRPRLTVEESIHTIGRKTHSCDWKEFQSQDRHLTLAHRVIDLDVAVASFLMASTVQLTAL